jgi:hypothetical protein
MTEPRTTTSHAIATRRPPRGHAPSPRTCALIDSRGASFSRVVVPARLIPTMGASIDVRPRSHARLEDYRHSRDRRHFVLVGILNVARRDRKHRSGYDIGRPTSEPGHGVARLAADRDDRRVADCQRHQFESLQGIGCSGQSTAKRRHLHRLELKRAVREQSLRDRLGTIVAGAAPRHCLPTTAFTGGRR